MPAFLNVVLWLMAGSTVVSVVLLSVVPLNLGGGSPLKDELFHVLGYLSMTLSLLLAGVWAPVRGFGQLRGRSVHLSLGVLGLGIGIELIQSVIPYREAAPSDAAANLLGTAVGFMMWRGLLRTKRTRPYIQDSSTFSKSSNDSTDTSAS